MLTSRDVINLKYVKEVGTGLSPAKTDDAENSVSETFLPGKVCCPHWAFKCTIALDCYTYHLDAESMKISFLSVIKQLFFHSSGGSLFKRTERMSHKTSEILEIYFNLFEI